MITEGGISGNMLILEKHYKSNFPYEIMAKDVITLFPRCLTLQSISCQSLGCSEGLLGVPTSASCPGKNWYFCHQFPVNQNDVILAGGKGTTQVVRNPESASTSADDREDLFQAGEGVKPCRRCSYIL